MKKTLKAITAGGLSVALASGMCVPAGACAALGAALWFGPQAALAAEASQAFTVSVGSGKVGADGTVTLPVTMENCPGIAAFRFFIDFDSENYTLTAINRSSGGPSGMVSNTGSEESGGLGVITWYAMKDMVFSGEVFTLVFTAKEGCSAKASTVTLSNKSGDVCNYDLEDVAVTYASGTISNPAAAEGGESSGEGDNGESGNAGGSTGGSGESGNGNEGGNTGGSGSGESGNTGGSGSTGDSGNAGGSSEPGGGESSGSAPSDPAPGDSGESGNGSSGEEGGSTEGGESSSDPVPDNPGADEGNSGEASSDPSTIVTGKTEYKVTGKKAVSLTNSLSSAAKVSVPSTITVDGVTYKITALAASAFASSKAKAITVGPNVTTIGKKAFANCTKLTSLTLGAAVKTIGTKVLSGSKKLTSVTVKSSKLTKASITNLLKGTQVKTIKCGNNVTAKAKANYIKWAKAAKKSAVVK